MATVNLILPQDPELLASAGRVAFAHGQLEYILRMTVKTLARMDIGAALDATEYKPMRDLRREINRLAGSVFKNDQIGRLKVEAILNRSARLSRRRNELIHRPLASATDGTFVAKDENHFWGTPPTPDILNQLAAEIMEVMAELNHERLHGFIAEAMKPSEQG